MECELNSLQYLKQTTHPPHHDPAEHTAGFYRTVCSNCTGPGLLKRLQVLSHMHTLPQLLPGAKEDC